MTELVNASLEVPTVVFTIALGIVLVYWLTVVIGLIDHDVFGHDHDFGIGAVPITVTVSCVVLVAWIASLLVMHYVVGPGAALWLRAVLGGGFVAGALPISALLVRPLAPVFELREGKANADYAGHACTITTGHVDERFGQATIEDGGTVLVVQVRCDAAGKLARGDKAFIIEFDQARQAYLVEKE